MKTVVRLFLDRVTGAPGRVAFHVPEPKKNGDPAWPTAGEWCWRPVTLGEAHDQVAGLARRLHALGVDHGVPVAILAETSEPWAAVDLAVLALGGITVGIYPTLPGEEVAYQLSHSGARVLVVEDRTQADKVAPFLDDLPNLSHVVSLEPDAGVPPLVAAEPDHDWFAHRAARLKANDVATVVYTSGTTGRPKGAVLTHGNFAAIIEASRSAFPTRPGDRSIVFLPLAHVLQRFALYRGLAEDVTGHFAPSIAALPETIQVCRPTVLVTVPRMLEKIRATAEAKAAERGRLARQILDWAIGVGRARAACRRGGERVPLRLRAQAAVADRLVLATIRERLGGQLRAIVSGGAALSVEVAEWFEALGVSVCEGWGLTETCAPATINRVEGRRLGTVGPPLPGTEIRLAEDGEVLVRGPGVFQGYLHDPAATAEVLDEQGWFRTGDLGALDPDGFLRIIGRKKAIIVTAGGKNIAPVPIEKRIEGDVVEHAVVIGDERPYLVALVSLDPEVVGDLGRAAADPAILARVAARIDAANAGRARFETIKKFAVLPNRLAVETGELTPTLKPKRRVIADKYAAVIDELYFDG